MFPIGMRIKHRTIAPALVGEPGVEPEDAVKAAGFER
jgi:hypothetical protein